MIIILYANIMEQYILHCIIYSRSVNYKIFSLFKPRGELIVNIYERGDPPPAQDHGGERWPRWPFM